MIVSVKKINQLIKYSLNHKISFKLLSEHWQMFPIQEMKKAFWCQTLLVHHYDQWRSYIKMKYQ